MSASRSRSRDARNRRSSARSCTWSRERPMAEAVIVAAARTPIGRAHKGSLVDARPDDLVAFAIDEMDRYAQRSQERAVAAQDAGFFAREITAWDGVIADDGPRRGSTLEKLAELEPAFKPGGKVTAGNSCPLNDGAAAVVVMSDSRARELGIEPRARLVASAASAPLPELMGLGPADAART